jgi:hypothetical protein
MTDFIDVDAYRYEIDLVTPAKIDVSKTVHIDLTNDEPDESPSPSPHVFPKVESSRYVPNNR